MRALIEEVSGAPTPELVAERLQGEDGVVLLRSGRFDTRQGRYSFATARPFLRFRSWGSRCELCSAQGRRLVYGNPWRVLEGLMARYEMADEPDVPFPLGGAFGYWGYELKNFVEPKLSRRAFNDLELPDCQVGFHDSLVVFDHELGKTWIVCTGLDEDGTRREQRACEQAEFWRERLGKGESSGGGEQGAGKGLRLRAGLGLGCPRFMDSPYVSSNLSRGEFLQRVERAQAYIRSGDVYQVNLSHRLSAPWALPVWELFQNLSAVSPAPFAAYLDAGDFQIVSSSPELFLRLSGPHIQTRPIKGTRPRSTDATRDAQLGYELQTCAKELAELVMITDLLRNDLGKVCEFGSVQATELARLERYAQVQHLVSTVEGRLRPEATHLSAFASCFPGGSITGAPKFRAMEIIDELEPVARGPYTGALGYLGFNRESQLSVLIRTAVCTGGKAWFHVGAGIVADSKAEAEYEETLAKGEGFLGALRLKRSAKVVGASPALIVPVEKRPPSPRPSPPGEGAAGDRAGKNHRPVNIRQATERPPAPSGTGPG